MKKRLVLILDGLGEPDSPSTLETARTPFLDKLAQNGTLGFLDVQPSAGMKGSPMPTSERGILSLFGWPAEKEIPSRALLLAESLEKPPAFDTPRWVWLLNPAFVSENRLVRYVEIGSGVPFWDEFLGRAALDPSASEFTFVPLRGSDGRLLRLLAFSRDTDEDPGDSFPPSGEAVCPDRGLAGKLLALSRKLIPDGGEFNCVWPWGVGKWHPKPRDEKPGPAASRWLIGAVPLALGIARALGWHAQGIASATGDVDTSLEHKKDAILNALRQSHVSHVFCHVEGFDLASHRRSRPQKRAFLERFDSEVVPDLLLWLDMGWLDDVWITCDHLSSPDTGDHAAGPVPYLHAGRVPETGSFQRFSEKEARKGQWMCLSDWNRAIE